jgi:hypothetical protein
MPNRVATLCFLLILSICPFLINSCAHNTSDQTTLTESQGASGENQSNIISGDSQIPENREREARMKTEGTIVFDRSQHAGIFDPDFGHGQAVFISTIVDKREGSPGKHVGTLYTLLHHAPYTRLYNTETLDRSMSSVIASFLSANGFSIKRIQDSSQSALIIEGTINKLWVGLHHSIYGEVDIDIKVIDSTNEEVLWSGKIAKTKETETKRGGGYAAFYGVMGDGTELEPFLNDLVSEAVVEAWEDGGLKSAFTKIAKREHHKKALEQLAATEPSQHDAQANLKLGMAYYELSSFDNAAKYLKKASQIDPTSARIHYLLGSSYLKAGKKDLAIDQYESLRKLDENYANKLFNEIY